VIHDGVDRSKGPNHHSRSNQGLDQESNWLLKLHMMISPSAFSKIKLSDRISSNQVVLWFCCTIPFVAATPFEQMDSTPFQFPVSWELMVIVC
jgi:hypothetical protein